MPILECETDLFPATLFEHIELDVDTDRSWWALYTRSRREKDLMRRLLAFEIPFYGPTVPQQRRSPAGRVRTSHVPLFSNYVFMWGNPDQRYHALSTNCLSRCLEVPGQDALTTDLRSVHSLIHTGEPVTVEERLEPGRAVRVRSGPLAGQKGTVTERRGQRRLIISVEFLQQAVSVELDDFEVEAIY